MDGAGDVEGRAPGVAAERWITSQAGTTIASQSSSAKPSSYSGETTGSPSFSPSSSSWANKIPQPVSPSLSSNPPSSFNASRETPSIARNTFSAPRVVSPRLVSGFGMYNTSLSSHHHPTLFSQHNFQQGSIQKPTKTKTHGQAPAQSNHSNGPTYGDPKESGHDVSTGSTYYPAVGNEKLYEAYNHLHSLAQDFHKPFDAPAIVVVGHQTDGKSAMGFQFNHVGGGTKTRRPITLHMKYNALW